MDGLRDRFIFERAIMMFSKYVSACLFGTLPLWFTGRRFDKKTGRPVKNKDMFPKLKPEIEQLETRFMPSVINFSAGTYSVNENAGKYTVNVNLDQADPNNTITVDYATSNGSASAGTDYTSTSGTLTFSPNTTNQTFDVWVTDDDVNDANKTVTLTLSNAVNATLGTTYTSTLTINLVHPTTTWTAATQQRVDDPFQATLFPYGPDQFSPTTGSLMVSNPLDFRRSLPLGYDAWDNEGIPTPALVYWSDTVSVQPILEATLAQHSGDSTPTQIVATLTWNGGTAQSPVTFSNFTTSNTSVYMVGVQVGSAVTSTGVYSWSITMDASFSNRGDVVRTVTGKADVVVNDTTQGLGYGWGIEGITDHLVADGSNGMLWVYGAGGSRYFSGSGGTYTSPANDFGTLVKNVNGSFTYTAVNQVQWNFDSSGNLTSISDANGLSETLTYSGGLLSTVTAPDGGVTTFTYTSSLLSKITEPGGRVVTVTIDGSNNLTNITNPDGGLRTLTYDANHRMTNEKFGPFNTTFAYDSTNHTLTSFDQGESVTLTVAAESAVALNTNPAKRTSDAVAVITTAAGGVVTMTLDQEARVTAINVSGSVVGLPGVVQIGTWTRNSAGQITAYTDALLRTTTYTYSGADMTRIDYPGGGNWQYTYDPTYHTVTQFQDSLSHKTTFTYNAYGDLATMKNALNQVTTYVWSSGLLGSVTNPLNQTTTYQYDTSTRRLTDIVDALNGRTSFTYSTAGDIASVQDANGNFTSFTYDGMRRILTQTNALSGVETLTYNAVGDVLTKTDELGHVTSFTYNVHNWLASEMDAVGTSVQRTTTFVYDVLGNLTTEIDPNAHRVTMTYDNWSRLRTRKSPVGGIETFTYDNVNNLTAYTDALNHTITYTYNSRNWVTSVRDALNNVTTFTYDTEGDVLTKVNARGYTTTYSYDALNRLQTTKDALSDVTTYIYDAAGNLQAIEDARGNFTTFTFDALQRQTAVTDALNHTITTVYDAVGNVINTTDALNKTSTFTYDALNRLVTAQAPLQGTVTYVYDAASNLVNTIDSLGHKVTFVYDELNRRTQTIDALAGKTTIVYDGVDNVLNVIDSVGNKTTFIYDAADRVITRTDPNNHSATFVYDLANNLTSTTDRLGNLKTLAYDADNRLTGETWTSGGNTVNVVTLTYDAVGNLLTAGNNNGNYTFTYDALDRVSTQQDMWATTLTFTYDAVSNRTGVQDSFSGIETSTYDAANRLTARAYSGTSLTPFEVDFTYTVRNQIATLTRLNNSLNVGVSTYTYDDAGRVTNIQHSGNGTALGNFTYTYDNANRVLTDVINGTTTTYTYDNTNQLTADSTHTYTFDANGNRNSTGYTTGTGNRMTNDGVWAYTYDNSGELTKKSKGASAETWNYTYNMDGQMVSAEKHATDGGTLQSKATYVYDVFGRRIEKDVWDGTSTTTTKFAWEGQNLWADLNNDKTLQTRYMRGDTVDQLLARMTSTGVVTGWYNTDRLGSVRNITDVNGNGIDTITYDGWGNVLTESSVANGDRMKFTGKELDSETGLQYNLRRYYDASTGRWTSEDPIGFGGGDSNLFRYVYNGSSLFRDPAGLFADPNAFTPPQNPFGSLVIQPSSNPLDLLNQNLLNNLGIAAMGTTNPDYKPKNATDLYLKQSFKILEKSLLETAANLQDPVDVKGLDKDLAEGLKKFTLIEKLGLGAAGTIAGISAELVSPFNSPIAKLQVFQKETEVGVLEGYIGAKFVASAIPVINLGVDLTPYPNVVFPSLHFEIFGIPQSNGKIESMGAAAGGLLRY